MGFKASTCRVILACVAVAAFAAAAMPASAEDRYASILFQNDVFLGRDGGGYTNGIFLSNLRIASPGERGIEPPYLLKAVVGWLGMPQSTLAASTLGQVIVTPRDLSRRIPAATDAPYIGALMFRQTHVWVHDDIADMAAIDLGVIGPAAGGEQVQRFVHRLTGSTQAEGWDSQVRNKALVGVERYRAWRFPWGEAEPGKPGGELIALAGGTLGNFESSVGGSMMLRYGQGLERSFPTVARASAQSSDPMVVGRGWFAFAGLSADRIFNHVGVSSDAPGSSAARLRKDRLIATAGLAYGWTNASLSFSLQSSNPLVESSNRRQSYGSITYAVQLR